jgi:hypothetical protein
MLRAAGEVAPLHRLECALELAHETRHVEQRQAFTRSRSRLALAEPSCARRFTGWYLP